MTDTRQLGGRYDVGDLIGEGGMAEVHHGYDTRLGRDVAVKFLRTDLSRDPSFHNRFRREAQAAASLSHPAIVAVYDTGDDGGADGQTPYIVMEYVRGETLRDVVNAEGRLLPQRALEITADILRALDYSHRHGIVHRDVKPGNVMLTRGGEVKVMDFGIARAVTASTATMTQTAAVIGTAQYLSPEQARGDHVDARSDIYSTGCLLYELLTGAPPFTGESPVAVAYQHVREEPVPPSLLEPDLPAGVDAIVLKAMAKNPANRYQTAEEMRADIGRALAGRPVQARPVVAEEPTVVGAPPATTVLLRRPEPRKGRRAAAYTLLGLATLAVFIVAALVARAAVSGRGSTDINTPDVTGHTLAEAEQILSSKGLTTDKPDFVFDQSPKNTVINQTPLPGILLGNGDTVHLTVSKGLEIVTVPQLVGLSRDNAEIQLQNSKLKVGDVKEQHSSSPVGEVLGSLPEPGAQVPAGSAVTLVVSDGQVQVPTVVDLDPQAAAAELRQAGFEVAQVETHDPTKPVDVVVAQDPRGGSFARQGSTVTITVNREPEPTPTPSDSLSPSPSETPSGSPSPNPSGSLFP